MIANDARTMVYDTLYKYEYDIPKELEDKINEELEEGWLIELFYEARGDNGNKIIVTLYKEEDNAEGDV